MSNLEILQRSEILVVDDIPENLRLLMDMLVEQGYKVRPAIDGEQALSATKFRAPDLIMLDIKMPGIDGFEVCRRLKKCEDTRNIAVIFISALDQLSDRIKGFEVGGVDYITKPFQREEVFSRIKTHCITSYTQRAGFRKEYTRAAGTGTDG